MKVVLFCGGLGMRMRSGSESLPKPMMPIGNRPVLWHVMRYYSHFGHNEFVLALGYGSHVIKDYFLNYEETGSNDFVLSKGGRHVDMLSTDISDWSITFIDTGLDTAIGERLRRVRPYLDEDEVFLANYGDVLTDAPMNDLIDDFLKTDAVGSLLAVNPQNSFHVVNLTEDNRITGLTPAGDMKICINGGYFILRQGIFDYVDEGDDLVMDGCVKAARDGKMLAVPYDGFWAPMDTLKERNALEDEYQRGIRPWALWLDRPVEQRRPPNVATVAMPRTAAEAF